MARLTNRNRIAVAGIKVPAAEALAYAILRYEEFASGDLQTLSPAFRFCSVSRAHPDRNSQWTIWLTDFTPDKPITVFRRRAMWHVDYGLMTGMCPTLVGAIEIALT